MLGPSPRAGGALPTPDSAHQPCLGPGFCTQAIPHGLWHFKTRRPALRGESYDPSDLLPAYTGLITPQDCGPPVSHHLASGSVLMATPVHTARAEAGLSLGCSALDQRFGSHPTQPTKATLLMLTKAFSERLQITAQSEPKPGSNVDFLSP